MSPAVTQVALTAWTSHYSRANCAHCDWSMSDESDRRTTNRAQSHVSSNPGHIVAIDRGQTRYAKSAGAFAAARDAEISGGNAMLDAAQDERPGIMRAAHDRGRGLRDG